MTGSFLEGNDPIGCDARPHRFRPAAMQLGISDTIKVLCLQRIRYVDVALSGTCVAPSLRGLQPTEAPPSWKRFGMNQHGVDAGMVCEFGIDGSAEDGEVLFALRLVGFKHHDAFGFPDRVFEHGVFQR